MTGPVIDDNGLGAINAALAAPAGPSPTPVADDNGIGAINAALAPAQTVKSNGSVSMVPGPDGTPIPNVTVYLHPHDVPVGDASQSPEVAPALSMASSIIPGGNAITNAMGAAIAYPVEKLQGDDLSMGQLYDQAQADTQATEANNPVGSLVGTAGGVVAGLPAFGAVLKGAGSAINATPIIGDIARFGKAGSDANLLVRAGSSLLQGAKAATVAAPIGAGVAQIQGNDPTMGAVVGGGLALAGGPALDLASNAVDLGKGIVAPFTAGGRTAIAANAIAKNASLPMQDIMAALNGAKELVPGSPFTTAEASGDPGLLSMQRGLRNSKAGNAFADIESQQNAARNVALNNIAGTKADLNAAELSRGAMTGPMYDNARSAPIDKSYITPVLDHLDTKIASYGDTDTAKTLQSVRDGIANNLDTKDNTALIQKYKELRDKVNLTADKEGAYSASVKGVVKPILHDIKTAIQAQNPDFESAESKFAEMSKPVNQMETLQDLRNKVTLKGQPDVTTGHEFLSQPALSGALRDTDGELAKTLTPDQIDTLNSIKADMQRSGAVNARNIAPVGSATKANDSFAEHIGGLLTDHVVSKIPLGIGNRILSKSQGKIDDLMMQAMRNPDAAKSILGTLRPGTNVANLPKAQIQALAANTLFQLRGSK